MGRSRGRPGSRVARRRRLASSHQASNIIEGPQRPSSSLIVTSQTANELGSRAKAASSSEVGQKRSDDHQSETELGDISQEMAPYRQSHLDEVFMTDNTGDYILAALVNVISCLKGQKAAEIVQSKLGNSDVFFSSVANATRVVEGLGLCVGMRRSPKEMRSFSGILEASRGVYIVRLLKGNYSDRVVAVDCRRRFIYDCVERYPLRLEMTSLMLCVGEGRKKPRVGEVREIFKAGEIIETDSE